MSRTQWLMVVLFSWLAVNALLTVAFSLSGTRHRRRGGVPDGAGRKMAAARAPACPEHDWGQALRRCGADRPSSAAVRGSAPTLGRAGDRRTAETTPRPSTTTT